MKLKVNKICEWHQRYVNSRGQIKDIQAVKNNL